MAKTERNPADFIQPLNMNGLSGRMLHLPAPKSRQGRELLMIYGHHSTLERWWGLAQNFNKFGAVTMPDLPGFGGMETMYSIGKTASLDNMADYLASFVKWRYKRKKVMVVGLSYGFLVVTRMLQRYPELTKRVEFLVSAVGFSHYDDFVFSKSRLRTYRSMSRLFTAPPLAWLFRYAGLNQFVLRQVYAKTFNAKKKFEGADSDLAKRLMDMEVVLWQCNDVRTYMQTSHDMLTVDNCRSQVHLPLWHVAAAGDQYFDGHMVEQHLKVIFDEVHVIKNKSLRHAPSVIATAEESAIMIPPQMKRVLLSR